MSARHDIGRARLTGATAQDLLSLPDFSGQVLAVVSNAVYLAGSGGEVVWVAQEKLPAHPRSILGSFDLTAVRAGMSCWRADGCLQFGREDDLGLLRLDLANASVWQPAVIRPQQTARRDIVSARVRQLLGALRSRDRGESLGQAIPLVSAIANGGDAAPAPSSRPFVAAALMPIQEIARACRGQDFSGIVKAGRALVGLGPGLTPSGDDFLGALLFMAHYLCEAYPGELHWEQQPIDNLLDWARAQTNRISHTLLTDHARGQGAEPLHDLVAAILKGKAPDEIMTNVRRLLEIGSTSGWDLLAGTVTGTLLIARANQSLFLRLPRSTEHALL